MTEQTSSKVTSTTATKPITDYLEPKLVENLESSKSLIENNQPFGIIIDGTPGMTKTTSAIMMAKFYQPDFSIEHQVGRGLKQFIKAYNFTITATKSPIKVCIYDEANDADKAGSMSRLLRVLNQMLAASSREERVITIIVLHRFYRFDERPFDNGLIHMLLNMYSKKEGHYVKFKAYDLDAILYMIAMIKKGKVLKRPQVYKMSSPNFGGRILAPPKELQTEINKHSKKGKDLLRAENTKEILQYKYLSIKAISQQTKQNQQRINYIIRSRGLAERYLRESHGKSHYYDPTIIDAIKEHILSN